MSTEKRKRGERGNGKLNEVTQLHSESGKFYIPTPICRDLGVNEGGILEFRRNVLENGTIEYTLHSLTPHDIFTGESIEENELIEYQGVNVSKKTIIHLAKEVGILPKENPGD